MNKKKDRNIHKTKEFKKLVEDISNMISFYKQEEEKTKNLHNKFHKKSCTCASYTNLDQ